MEKTNFTSQPFGWAKSTARAFALLVICCFAFQSATANHLVPIVGPQTFTPFSPADPSTFVEINPEDKILFKDGKTAIIVAQGMNCGEMTYEFFDGGSHLSNYSDNGGDQYFTICPQTPMTQRIVSVQFSEFNLEWQISEIFDEVVDQNEDRNGVDDTATGTPPPEVTPTGTVIRNIQIKRDVLNIWDGDDAVMGQDPRMMDDFTMYYLENFREDVVLAGEESVVVADASAPNPASPTTTGASDPNNDTDYPGTNFDEAARIATLATGDDHAANDNNPALPTGYGFDFLDDDIDDDVQDDANAVITPNPYDPGTPANVTSDMRPDDDNTTAVPPLFNDDDQDGGGIDYMYSVTMSGFDSGDANGYDRDASNLPNAGNPIFLRKGDCDAQNFATQILGDGSGCITFQLTTDGSGVASGWEAEIVVEEFAPSVALLGLNADGDGVANEDGDEIDADASGPFLGAGDFNSIVEIEDCSVAVPRQTLLIDFGCGLVSDIDCNGAPATLGNPDYFQQLFLDGEPVPFAFNGQVVPSTGTSITADPQNTIVYTPEENEDVEELATGANAPDDFDGVGLSLGDNEYCIVIGYDMNGDMAIDLGDYDVNSDGTFDGADADLVDPNAPGFDAGEVKSFDCFTITVTSQEPLACNDDLNIGLDGDCVVEITPDILLESPCEDGAGIVSDDYEITLTLIQADDDFMDPQGITDPLDFDFVSDDGLVDSEQGTSTVTARIPGRYRYTITLGGNTCWGFLSLEDKRGPVCAPAGDLEQFISYDRNCDGDINGLDGSFTTASSLGFDPSGSDDLESEYILCTVLDAAEDSGVGLEIYFDDLEAMDTEIDLTGATFDQDLVGDFFDCTGINNIFFQDEVTEITSLADLQRFSIDQTKYDVNRFEICEVYSRTWFAIDKKGYQSAAGCTQYIFSLRPKAGIIQLDQQAAADCADDVDSDCFQQSTAPYFSTNAFRITGAGDIIVTGRSGASFNITQGATVPQNERGIVNAGYGSCGTDIFAAAGHFGALGALIDECDRPTSSPSPAVGSIDLFVSPLVKQYVLRPNEHTCGYAVSFHQDPIIPICTDDNGDPSSYKVNRHWTVVDWKNNGARIFDEFTQLILVEDDQAPALISENGRRILVVGGTVVEDYRTASNPNDLRPYTIELGTKLFDCEASGNLPLLTTQDNCSADDITRITIERLDIDGHNERIFINDFRDASGAVGNGASIDNVSTGNGETGLPLGEYEVTYIFGDDCGNANEISIPLILRDNRIPEAICNDELVVTLVPGDAPGDQRARITGEDIDDTSFDACHPVVFDVRKAGDPEANDGDADLGWRPFVEFDCSDVTPIDGQGIRVELRITEDRNNNGRLDPGDRVSGTVANPVYLSNICWAYIRVEDKTPPVIDLDNGEYLCDDPELNALILTPGLYDPADGDALFPSFLGGCSTEGIVVNLLDVDDSNYDPICKVGTFFRTFRAQRVIHDNVIFGNTQTQRIDVLFNSEWTMTFPVDIVVECDDDGTTLDQVPAPSRIEDILDNEGCDQWAMEVDDEIFDIIGQDGDGACFKIVRTYKFINWCTWDPTNSEEGVVPRPLDFQTNPGLAVQLQYQSNPVLDICALRNLIDDEDDADAYDLLEGDFNGTVADLEDLGIEDRDADLIYMDEGFPRTNGDFPLALDADALEFFGLSDFGFLFDGDCINEYIVEVVGTDNDGDGIHDAPLFANSPDGPRRLVVAYLPGTDLSAITLNDLPTVSGDADLRGYFQFLGFGNTTPLSTFLDGAVNESIGEFLPNMVRNRRIDNILFASDEFFNHLIDDEQTHDFVSAEAYGYFIYRQIIKVVDTQAPVIDEIDDFTTCDDEDELAAAGITVVDDFENCSVEVTFPIPVVDECKPTYRIFYELDVNNDGTVELEGELPGDGEGNFSALTVTGISYGTHGFRYIVEDGCGNNELIDFDFTALDCKAPTAYCVLGVNIDLMPTGMVELWASDLDAGSFDDCSEPVRLSFSPNPADSGRVFTCDMRGSNFVQLWVTDAAGNQSFCETIVNVQADNPEECGVGALISAGVNTEMGEDVENVTLGLSGNENRTATTDVEGQFTFGALTPGEDYTVTPEKDLNPLNGVSTFDLVLIRKHIIDVAPLDSPYKLIAADVNNSGNITTLDMIRLRELILNIRTDFENNTSWRFVDAAYEFPTPSNPWAEEFPEVANFNDIATDVMNEANFIAVKVGDVNASAIPNMLLGSDERNSADVLAFNVADAAVAAGQEVTVDFTAEMVDVAGFQFTLNFDNNVLDLVEIVEGVATAENFGTTLANEGTITASWDGEATADDVLFSLTFAAKATANLSDLISVNSAVTAAEAYKGTEVLDVALNFGGANTAAGFELYQNTPNPFKGITTVSFNLPTAGAATLTVTDVTGKVLKVTQANYAKGFNQVQFSSADLKATGVLYYTLESADYTATKKMIIVE